MVKFDSSFVGPFRSHIRLSGSQLAGFLNEAMIVLDTNVLLDLYRVTPSARLEMLEVIDAAKERLWIPHHVALEFHRNRIGAAKDQLDFYPATCKSLEALKDQALQRINEFANRCALGEAGKKEMKADIEKAFGETVTRIEKHKEKFDIDIRKIPDRDPILARLSVMLDGRVGEPFEGERMVEVLKEAERRRSEKIPPGYKDGSKSMNASGDYILWEQILTEARTRGVDVLIVSNDQKEDWVEKQLNYAIGPREELVAEMRARIGVDLGIITFPSYLEAAKLQFRASVSPQTLDQARRTLKRDRETQSDVDALILSQETVNEVHARLKDLSAWSEAKLEESRRRQAEVAENDSDSLDVEAAAAEVFHAETTLRSVRDELERFEKSLQGSTRLGGDVRLVLNKYSRKNVVSMVSEIRQARQKK